MNAKISVFVICVVPRLKRSCICYYIICMTVPLKICLFAWGIAVFWILIEMANSEHSCKISYSGKESTIFQKYWGVPLWYLAVSWKNDSVLFLSLSKWQAGVYSGLVNRGILLKTWISMHQNNWIPERMNLFISLVKWPRKKRCPRE